MYRTFWKLANIIKNQINTYISSLFTCPVIWEQKRPRRLGSHPQNRTAPLISPLVYVLWLAPLLLCTLLPSPGNCDDKNSPNWIVVIALEKMSWDFSKATICESTFNFLEKPLEIQNICNYWWLLNHRCGICRLLIWKWKSHLKVRVSLAKFQI